MELLLEVGQWFPPSVPQGCVREGGKTGGRGPGKAAVVPPRTQWEGYCDDSLTRPFFSIG